jgi:hypothetical protein
MILPGLGEPATSIVTLIGSSSPCSAAATTRRDHARDRGSRGRWFARLLPVQLRVPPGWRRHEERVSRARPVLEQDLRRTLEVQLAATTKETTLVPREIAEVCPHLPHL